MRRIKMTLCAVGLSALIVFGGNAAWATEPTTLSGQTTGAEATTESSTNETTESSTTGSSVPTSSTVATGQVPAATTTMRRPPVTLDVLNDLQREYAPGESFTLNLVVRNHLDRTIEDFRIALKPDKTHAFEPDPAFTKNKDPKKNECLDQTADLRIHEERVFAFKLRVKAKPEGLRNVLPVELSFQSQPQAGDPSGCPLITGFEKEQQILLKVKAKTPEPPVKPSESINGGINGGNNSGNFNPSLSAEVPSFASPEGGYTGFAEGGSFGYEGGLSMGGAEVMKNKPKLIITKYTMSPTMAQAGQEFKLTMTFLNTNEKKSVNNIKISLSADVTGSAGIGTGVTGENSRNQVGNTFTPVGSSNTFYINRIDPQKEAEKTITFFVGPTIQSQNYNLLVSMEYEDPDGNQLEAKESIGIPVVQVPKIETDEVNVPESVMLGDPINIDFSVYNVGKDNLSNLMIEAAGNFQADPARSFVGNFASGASSMFSTSLIPTEEGPLNGKIVVSFEDSKGELHTVEKTFQTEVLGLPVPLDENGMPLEGDLTEEHRMGGNGKSLSAGPIIWIILILIVGGVIAIIVLRRKKANQSIKDLTLHE